MQPKLIIRKDTFTLTILLYEAILAREVNFVSKPWFLLYLLYLVPALLERFVIKILVTVSSIVIVYKTKYQNGGLNNYLILSNYSFFLTEIFIAPIPEHLHG